MVDAVITATTEIDWLAEEPTAHFALSDSNGDFRIEGLPSGSYRLNATSSKGWASAAAPLEHKAGQQTSSAALVLQRTGFLGRGVVRDEQGKPMQNAKVEALPLLPTDAAPAFAALSDARGEFSMMLPEGEAYLLIGTAPGRKRAYGRLDASARSADLAISALAAPMPDEKALAEWLAKDALPIASDDPEASLEDLAPLASWIGDASIVGLGEATHGTAEFFRLKHRLIKLLVSKLDFSVVAFECGAVEARLVDAYVKTGVGDPVALVRKLGTDPFKTEEVVAFVRWMRAHNADRRNVKKLSFVGFDETSWTSAAWLRDYLAKAKHDDADASAALTRLASVQADSTYPALERAVHEQTRVALQSIKAWLVRERPALLKADGEAAWLEAADHSERLIRLERSFLDPTLRDGQMADEVERIREAHKGERTVLWLHNGHGSAWARAFAYMGARLRQQHGSNYLSVGFTFGQGTFRALTQGNLDPGPVEQRIKGPAPQSLEAALVLASPALFAIDLRRAKDAVRQWLGAPTTVTEIGFLFRGEESARRWTVPLRAYDLVIHVDDTHAAVGLGKKR